MKVTAIQIVEDCFDGSQIKEIFLDSGMTEGFIHQLGAGFRFEYFAEFPRPFFRIFSPQFQIKGVLNGLSLRVIFNRSCAAAGVESLISRIQRIDEIPAISPDPSVEFAEQVQIAKIHDTAH